MASVTDLTRIRDEFGDELYYDQTTENPTIVYIVADGDTTSTPIKITDEYGNNPWIFSDYSYEGYTSTYKVYAVEATSEGYVLAIRSEYGYDGNTEISWTTYKVSSTGVLDWTSYNNNIINVETDFNEDLNLDGSIGFNESLLTQKTTDTSEDLLFVDSEQNLYIKTSSNDLISVVDSYNSSSIKLDSSSTWTDGFYTNETIKVVRYDNDTSSNLSDDNYYVLIKENSSYSGVKFNIASVDLEGTLDYSSYKYDIALSDWEEIFGEDLNEDGTIGFNASNLVAVTTDSSGALIKRDSVDGTLYLSASGTDYKIEDSYGSSPYIEYSYSMEEDSSYTSTVIAAELKSDGTYCLAVKTENVSNDNTDTQWNIYSLSTSGTKAILDWNNASYSVGIMDYEADFNQDLNGDSYIGFNTSSFETVSSDTVGVGLQKDSDGNIYIVDANGNNPVSLSDSYGTYTPQLEYSYSFDGSSNSAVAKAVTLIDAETDYYALAVKQTDTYAGETNVNWQVYKISLEGVLDWEGTSYLKSIVTWEDEFGQDLNGDDDFSGTIAVSAYGNDTDGATLGKADGALYIRPEAGSDILVNDNYIEYSSTWTDGSNSSTAIAANLHEDGYYQIAVKSTNTWTDYYSSGSYSATGTSQTSEYWAVYAVDTSGNIDWEKTLWPQAIDNFEISFNQDLNGDGSVGINIGNVTAASTDTHGWRLYKDSNKGLYVADSDGNNLMALGDGYGPSKYDYEYKSDYYSSKSEALAVEKNSDGTFTVVVKNTYSDSWNGTTNSQTDYQILEFSSTGVIDYNLYNWTQDIKSYEGTFNQDIDGDGAIGLDLTTLKDAGTDSFGDVLKKDASGNSFYILNDSGKLLLISEDWGGSASLEYSSSWDGGSWKQEAIAVESLTYTNKNDEIVNGYVIAIKNTSTYSGDNYTDWELKYTDSKGVIDWNMSTWTSSIKKSESLFGAGQDLDGDGATGLVDTALTTVSTDTVGASLKKDSENSLYIKDGSDLILITDEYGSTSTFDYSYSGGTGSDSYSYESTAYAVEDFVDTDGKKKYLLAIKNTNTFGSSSETSWQTYNIIEKTSGAGDWYLDWSTSSWGKGISKKEEIFGEDLNGNGSIDSASNISTTKIATDISSDANITGAQLCVDAEGSLYIIQNDTKIAIVDSYGGTPNFDYKYSWGNYASKSESYAVEGLDTDSNGVVDGFKLAIKNTETNTELDYDTVNWSTYSISATGVIDWNSYTWGDISRHEKDLNQDLDGDGEIWTTEKLNLTQLSTDNIGAQLFLDENGYAYIQASGSTTKNAIIDEYGNLTNFDYSYDYDQYSNSATLYAAAEFKIDNIDYYKLLIKYTETDSGTTKNYWETVSVLKSNNKIDWSTSNWYDDPKKLEDVFDAPELDGTDGIFTISSSDTTPISTDTVGAQLRQSSDGSLFIKDGDNTLTVTSPDGGYVDFDSSSTWDDGSYETKAIAAQKVGSNYKIVVKDSYTYSGSTDTMYTVYTLDSTATLDWKDIVYRTAEELNETEFGQDIDGDGSISSGSISSADDSYADYISTSSTDAETLSQIQNTAQSDIYSIKNADETSSDTNIEMYVDGIEGTAKASYEVDIKVVQTANDSLIAKAASDTGLSTTDITPLTGVMDFSVTIQDPDNYYKIVSMSFVLPEGTENPKYFKKDVISGEYFDFVYDPNTGEGTQWDPETRTLKVSIKDNGKYDSDNTPGVVKDPGFTASGKDTKNPVLSVTFPTDNATAAPHNANFELTFSEKVDTKTGNIVIKKKSDDSVVETIDVTSNLVTGTGTNKITIDPAADLALDTEYYIQIDATAFDDKAGNSFAGITDKTTFSFKTSSTDIAPTLISATPADDATSTSHLSNIELSFSETIKANSGNILIYRKSDDALIETIDITSALVTINNNKVVINPSSELESGTEYYIQINSTALVDSGNTAYAGIEDKVSLSFTTSPYLFTSTNSDQVIVNTGKSYSQSSSNLSIGSLTYKIYSFDGEISSDKFYNVRSVYTASINAASSDNVTLNSRALDFQLTTQSADSTVVFDADLVANGLSVTDGSSNRDASIYWTYYSINDDGTISTLNYNPIKNAGAKFFDTSGNGIADFIHLELVDGGYGDKDGVVNGIIKDPSAAGTATLDPDFAKVDATTLNIVDSTKSTTPATIVLNAALDLTTRTDSVDEIGYVVLNNGESALTIDQFKTRARTLFNTLEKNDVTLTETTNNLYSQELYVANNQNITLFKVKDGSISDISSLTDSKLSYFSIDTLGNDTTLMKSTDGMSVTLTQASVDPGIDELIGNLQHEAPLLDFASVPNKLGSITATMEYAREASLDSVLGFYRVIDSEGSVIDSVTGNVIKVSDANYKDHALATSNLVTELANISIADDQSTSKKVTIDENSIIAPYATTNGETWFAFGSANSDGISHFKSFGTNSFGLEDLNGGGDKDYDDFIVKFDFNSVST